MQRARWDAPLLCTAGWRDWGKNGRTLEALAKRSTALLVDERIGRVAVQAENAELLGCRHRWWWWRGAEEVVADSWGGGIHKRDRQPAAGQEGQFDFAVPACEIALRSAHQVKALQRPSAQPGGHTGAAAGGTAQAGERQPAARALRLGYTSLVKDTPPPFLSLAPHCCCPQCIHATSPLIQSSQF